MYIWRCLFSIHRLHLCKSPTRVTFLRPPWALVGQALVGTPGPLWAPLGPCGLPGPLWAGPLWAPWALVGRALVGPPGPLWARPLWAGP